MKQLITAKLKLSTNAVQFQALRRAQLAYRDALNAVSRYAFVHGKMSNQHALQRACYKEMRHIWLASADGLQRASSGGRDLQDAVDEGAGQHRGTGRWPHQATL